jgi:hypothetical protein
LKLFEVDGEEAGQLVEWDQLHSIIQINMAGTGNDQQLFRLGSQFVGFLNLRKRAQGIQGTDWHETIIEWLHYPGRMDR